MNTDGNKTAPSALRWAGGNRFQLLENGEEYFPAVLDAIAAARCEIFIETFILFDDKVGRELQEALIAAGRRGVGIDVTVDGYGSPDLSEAFIGALTAAGVRLHIFDPRPRLFGMRTNIFRRLHRKIVAIDGRVAFVGGINFGIDQLKEFGPMAKQDYAVRIEGPLAEQIHAFAKAQVSRAPRAWRRRNTFDAADAQAKGSAMFVTRDNVRHRDDIERHYRMAIRMAKREIVIANAYFFPGYRLLKQMRRAAQRGVSVKLILQGEPDLTYAKSWASLLYPQLARSGVEIYEYRLRPLHGKVAVVDDDWATVGSSNLDPLSLSLNLEANVMIRDPEFVADLKSNLHRLLQAHCVRIDPECVPPRRAWRTAVSTIAFHLTRYFPVFARWLPTRAPKVKSIGPTEHDAIARGQATLVEAQGSR